MLLPFVVTNGLRLCVGRFILPNFKLLKYETEE